MILPPHSARMNQLNHGLPYLFPTCCVLFGHCHRIVRIYAFPDGILLRAICINGSDHLKIIVDLQFAGEGAIFTGLLTEDWIHVLAYGYFARAQNIFVRLSSKHSKVQ